MMMKVRATTLIMTLTITMVMMMMMTMETNASEWRANQHHQLPKRSYKICSGPSNVPARVCTNTGSGFWGELGDHGTDSVITISLGGSKCHSTWQELDNPGNTFTPGDFDCFNFNTQDVGAGPYNTVSSIRIHSDMSGAGPGWKLEHVTTQYNGSSKCKSFRYSMWINDTYDKEHRRPKTTSCV
ncbi:hypothetical protein V1264_023778 [Littorina saxatilis]|uniref:PLAT domain-containing protein n=1 Tax=Littorina saxatilis TaxID=31220 RepID=A0AAN9BCD6_9CAEN